MRPCRACGRPIEDHKVVGKRVTITPRGPIPGHSDRLYECDVVRTGTVPRTGAPVWTPRGAVKAQDAA